MAQAAANLNAAQHMTSLLSCARECIDVRVCIGGSDEYEFNASLNDSLNDAMLATRGLEPTGSATSRAAAGLASRASLGRAFSAYSCREVARGPQSGTERHTPAYVVRLHRYTADSCDDINRRFCDSATRTSRQTNVQNTSES
jgi:hypothetical protein